MVFASLRPGDESCCRGDRQLRYEPLADLRAKELCRAGRFAPGCHIHLVAHCGTPASSGGATSAAAAAEVGGPACGGGTADVAAAQWISTKGIPGGQTRYLGFLLANDLVEVLPSVRSNILGYRIFLASQGSLVGSSNHDHDRHWFTLLVSL